MAQQVADFVLSRPSSEHETAMRKCIDTALNALAPAIKGDPVRFERSIAKFGSLPKPKPEPASEKAA